ncbi:MAG: HAD family hydrolase [Candidatus Aenigmatarchaeota archaeon]
MVEEFKGIVFDMDGVLVNSMQYHAVSFEKTLKKIGVDVDRKDVYMLEGEGSELVIRDILGKKGVETGDEIVRDLVEKKREMFDEIENTEPFPGIRNFLERLKNKFKLGLVTGTNRDTAQGYIEEYFGGVFDEIITEDDTENKKPEPEPYSKCFERLGLSSEEVLVVENAPLGVKAAKRAGATCWAIATYVDSEALKGADADSVFENHEEFIEHAGEALLPG